MRVEYWENSFKAGWINLDNRGRIGRNAEIVFTQGHCHSFAAALHTLTGWPIVGFVCHSIDNRKDSPGHVACKISKREYCDILGPGALVRQKEKYPDTRVYKLGYSDISSGLDCYLPLAVEKAIPFAKTMLQKYFGDTHV